MKLRYYITCFIVLSWAASCRTVKKAEHIQKQLNQNDTSKIVMVTPNMESPELDSLHKILAVLDSQKIDQYATFTAKVKLDYSGADNNASATANIRMRKDSVIWVSLTGPFAIEGFRVMIRPDSLVLMDKLKHVVMRRSISYLEEIAQLPISFTDLQNIIIGNPLFTKGKVVSYRHIRNRWFASLKGDVFKNFIAVISNNRKLILKNSRIENEGGGRKRTCAIEYSNYTPVGDIKIAAERKIELVDKKKIEVKLQFRDCNFNQPVTFPFSIPKSYTEK